MAKSYFAILGISPNATLDEIRSAYRRLVKEFHPDHYTGGSERFRDIQEAYSVLGDYRSRREYEQSIRKVSPKRPLRPSHYTEPEPLIPEDSPVDIGEVSPVRSFQSFTPSYDEIFDWLWSNFSDLTQPKSARACTPYIGRQPRDRRRWSRSFPARRSTDAASGSPTPCERARRIPRRRHAGGTSRSRHRPRARTSCADPTGRSSARSSSRGCDGARA